MSRVCFLVRLLWDDGAGAGDRNGDVSRAWLSIGEWLLERFDIFRPAG